MGHFLHKAAGLWLPTWPADKAYLGHQPTSPFIQREEVNFSLLTTLPLFKTSLLCLLLPGPGSQLAV